MPDRPATTVAPTADATVVDLVDAVIEQALGERASDIHLEPTRKELLVRFRIDGLLRTVERVPHRMATHVTSSVKALANLDIAEKRVPQDGRRTSTIRGRDIDLRISTLPSLHGEKVVIRLLPQDAVITDMKTLGFSPEQLATYRGLLAHAQGLILNSGPTGSGKTTTLYASMLSKRDPTLNLVTIEDPIEYQLDGVVQVQLHPRAGLTFASGLRSILRQDPDVIMVGEIRDKETASIVFQSALTGHLVFSTLHTNDTAAAITRLVDIGVEPYLISSALIGVIAQRLVRRSCTACTVPVDLTREEIELLKLSLDAAGHRIARGKGCKACFNTGYWGREAVLEIMPTTDTIRQLIHDRAGEAAIREQALKLGMKTLVQSGIDKILAGITTPEELLRVLRL